MGMMIGSEQLTIHIDDHEGYSLSVHLQYHRRQCCDSRGMNRGK